MYLIEEPSLIKLVNTLTYFSFIVFFYLKQISEQLFFLSWQHTNRLKFMVYLIDETVSHITVKNKYCYTKHNPYFHESDSDGFGSVLFVGKETHPTFGVEGVTRTPWIKILFKIIKTFPFRWKID